MIGLAALLQEAEQRMSRGGHRPDLHQLPRTKTPSAARDIATVLEGQGWSVWWDPAIRSGESFVSLINREIGGASCVVVLWSKASVVSRWVLEEAHNGLNRGILCPLVIDRDVQLPVGFATVKYIPLWDWRYGAPVGGYSPLFNELTRVVGPPAQAALHPRSRHQPL